MGDFIIHINRGKDWRSRVKAGVKKWKRIFDSSFDMEKKTSGFTLENFKKLVDA